MEVLYGNQLLFHFFTAIKIVNIHEIPDFKGPAGFFILPVPAAGSSCPIG
jgi:hypothetical protein